MSLILKFLLLSAFAVVSGVHSSYTKVIPYSLIELFILFYISNAVSKSHKKTGYFLNLFFSLIFLLQQTVLFLNGEFISQIMIDNLNMISNLGDLIYTAIISTIIIIAVSCIPFKPIKNRRLDKYFFIVLSAIFIWISFSAFIRKNEFRSPLLSSIKIIANTIDVKIKAYKYSTSDCDEIFEQFHKNSIKGSSAATKLGCPNKPNVIILFMEGFSECVMDVNNDLNLNLTPNLNKFYNKSLSFSNYYNHTAATFRGLRGQLYSGHQYLGGYYNSMSGLGQIPLDDLQKQTSTKLISLIDILKDNGYHTSFVNSEHTNKNTIGYFKSFKFDELLMDTTKVSDLSDREAFALLEKSILNAKSPFFIGMYNIGTHNGYDSPDAKYGDGSNPILNRFHNFDVQFGVFIDKLSQTNILDNTILIVTTDHASYMIPEYINTFNLNKEEIGDYNTFFYKIPFLIYWNGIEPQNIDVKGRNSICFTPTILDLLKIYDHENYFMGTSLFLKNKNIFETVSSFGENFYYTGKNNRVEHITEGHEKAILQIKQYFHISLNNTKTLQ